MPSTSAGSPPTPGVSSSTATASCVATATGFGSACGISENERETFMNTTARYTRALIELLDKLAESQNQVLDDVAHRAADALQSGGLIHLFGSGHSVIPTIEAFPRYGSFAGIHPLTDPRLMWHDVLGSGGVRELLWLERTEGYIDKFLDHEPLNPGDLLVVYSHGGRNSAG